MFIPQYFLDKRPKRTNGLRHQLVLKKYLLAKEKFLKNYTLRLKNYGGHNVHGHFININKTARARKIFKFKSTLYFGTYMVCAIHNSSLTNNYIMRVFNIQNYKTYYITAVKNLFVGSMFHISPRSLFPIIGNRYPIEYMPLGSAISNILIKDKIKFVRAAGTSAIILYRKKVFTKILLNSGKTYWIKNDALVTLGPNANSEYHLQCLGKASRNILKGIKPHVRGVAKNPIDHPHGGGQGKTKGGRPSVTPWGVFTKGKKTKKIKKKHWFYLV